MRKIILTFVHLLSGFFLSTQADERSAPNDPLAKYDARISQSDRQHWAFQPVKSARVPEVKQHEWVRNPIDAFVLARLEKVGWQPNPPAAPAALLRRVYLDVIGMPPTLEEQQSFLNDASPDRWEKLIRRLLARPGYGERWGRHWLDVVRYAETNGYERDATKPFVWRYRDYVIRAFNRDKPYDRFVREQLAGDELADADTESLIATGFHRLGPWDDEPADPKEDRFDQLDDVISTTSLTFLGLTMGCARCHDHKFDAITMLDYYRLAAIFDPLQRPRKGRQELALPAGPRQAIERLGQKEAAVKFPLAYFLEEKSPKAPTTRSLLRGKAANPGPEVKPGFPAVLVDKQPELPSPSQYTSRRRLALALWIGDAKNPLTARVIVNRVWQHHFGEGIVRTPNDFGVQGMPPTHRQLLDWLAAWFVKNDWSLKKLHHLILTSNTYRMNKRWRADYAKADPENELLWRFPYVRLEAEAIRDSTMAVSGQLNRKMFGPSTYPEVPKEALKGHSDPDKIWKPFNEEEASRRTVYAFIKRSFVVPILEVLDFCDTARSAARRKITTVAPQALTLLNGAFVNRQARHFANRLIREAGVSPEKQIERAYRLALCRPPTAKESELLVSFLKREAKQLRAKKVANAETQALEQVCRLIFNLNEYAYPD